MGERDQKHYKHTRRQKIPVMFTSKVMIFDISNIQWVRGVSYVSLF